jgi:fucose 4-O-acetylase-like acetyltransferase
MPTELGKQNSLEWISIAKGIGISLVVIGHFNPDSSPNYWMEIRRFISTFHMPLFFLLSGYLFDIRKYSYFDLIKVKARRLLYPFTFIALIFFLIKYAVGHFVSIKHAVNINNIYALLIDPVNSYMPLLWFVHSLFLIFAIYPLARVFINNYFLRLFSKKVGV